MAAFLQSGGLSPLSQGSDIMPSPSPSPSLSPSFPDVTGYKIPQPPQEVMNVIMKYFPQDQWENAARVAFGESSYDPTKIGPTNDYGLYQISPRWQSENLAGQGFSIEDMLNLEKAAQFAAWLQSKQGWNPWVAAKKMGVVGGE